MIIAIVIFCITLLILVFLLAMVEVLIKYCPGNQTFVYSFAILGMLIGAFFIVLLILNAIYG